MNAEGVVKSDRLTWVNSEFRTCGFCFGEGVRFAFFYCNGRIKRGEGERDDRRGRILNAKSSKRETDDDNGALISHP